MKVFFGMKFKALNGMEMPVTDGNPRHLGEAAANALMAPDPKDNDFSVKAKKYRLALRVYDGGVVDVSPEELVLMQTAMAALYIPLVCGQADDAFNGRVDLPADPPADQPMVEPPLK